eukprot:GHVU01200552.1.p1 GENE.GHVU01200552.1~~GHVU01200552.1.p1  ORF type:complete len:201 (-),score=32.33 GHVU01200552.1:507-1109(-)
MERRTSTHTDELLEVGRPLLVRQPSITEKPKPMFVRSTSVDKRGIQKTNDVCELSEDQFKHAREWFDHYDKKKDGHIPVSQLYNIMLAMGHKLNPTELQDLIDYVDVDKSGTIDWEEFLPLMAAKLKEQENDRFYRQLFRILDKHKRGYICNNDLRYILKGVAEEMDFTDADIEAMVTETDVNGDGKVTFDEFVRLMETD